MKISLAWLRDYVDVDLSPEELAQRLTRAGVETEGLETIDGDVVITLETTSNRPDHLGHIGIAREVAWICGATLRLPEDGFHAVPQVDGRALEDWIRVELDDRERCRRYSARMAVGVEVGPSPDWLARRLERLGLRPVNNVVDLSNYVLHEWGQPLHAFDHARVAGGVIHVRRATAGEQIVAINERTYKLTADDLVIADAERPLAIAGVMGGQESAVQVGTTGVLIESAWFEPIGIRRTARRLVLASDSSYRFERRVDPHGVEAASRRLAHLLEKHCGATILEGAVDVIDDGFLEASERDLELRPSRVTQVLGVDIPPSELREGLTALGFTVADGSGTALAVRVPSFRGDVTREIDLVEEVARVYGMDAVPDIQISAFPVEEQAELRQLEQLKDWLVGAGYREALTFAFVEGEEFAALECFWSSAEPYEVRNPVRTAERFLRRSMLGNLLKSARLNRHRGVESVRLFEAARVFHRPDGEARPRESLHVAWLDLGTSADFRDTRGVADGLTASLGVEGGRWAPVADELPFHRGEGAVWRDDTGARGLIGALEIDGVAEPIWCGELWLDPILGQASERHMYREFSRLPGIRRDVNMVFDEAVPWGDVERAIAALELADLEALEFVDVYRGQQVAAGKKSLTFALLFRSAERTLTSEEVEERTRATIARLEQQFGATLRS